ncbi:phosphodiesterase [Pontimonas salivibrio]|uniref:Phosphodiesterase n=1 Tax=Pontimonas salivibrio TaxID=1159327 RepID=A0A2L2BQF7_9MICO|nr:alkaline phosphatase family protein [Pontimonas salivibrio]AVG23905.1 phosphodiesterase [Pontimonas salivibrio]
MAPMLPGHREPTRSLADVSEELVGGLADNLVDHSLRASKVTFVVIDGLGAQLIEQHSGHARVLHRALVEHGEVISSGLPSTTAAALASITTGRHSGEHGLLGYCVRDPESKALVNHLKPYPAGVTSRNWQPTPTHFERLGERGVVSLAVGEERFVGTDFSESILRGAEFVASHTLDGHLQAYRSFWDQYDQGFAYLYWPGLDRVGHQRGVDSVGWRDSLEAIDSFIATLWSMVAPDEQVVVLADHGMVDVRGADQWILPAEHPVRSGIAAWAGEPRCAHLYLHDPAEASVIGRELQTELVSRASVLTHEEVMSQDIFGPVPAAHAGRIGDLVLFAEGNSALYDEATLSLQSLQMVGQHGSWSAAEVRVPAITLPSQRG